MDVVSGKAGTSRASRFVNLGIWGLWVDFPESSAFSGTLICKNCAARSESAGCSQRRVPIGLLMVSIIQLATVISIPR